MDDTIKTPPWLDGEEAEDVEIVEFEEVEVMDEVTKKPEKKKVKMVEFCYECSFTSPKPRGIVYCPACGGKVGTIREDLVKKAREDNKRRRGV